MEDLIKITKQILDDRYPDADVIFLAGSLLRGEGTPYSDLDLVVIFEQLPHAWRESFNFKGYPVEAFVHDPETFNHFIFELGRPSGLAAMAHMVAEGVEVPCAELYGALANYYFRANGLWSAVNKSIPRRLSKTNPELYSRFREGFEELFAGGESDKVITLAEEILKRHGGFLFDGYKHEASPACRKPLS